MNFKRPCWLAFFITLGMTLVGLFGFISTKWSPKDPGSWWTELTGVGSYFLMTLGAVGVVVSLIWVIIAVIICGSSHDPRV